MPACGQCGKENPEGTAFCGYCAYPLPKAANPASQQLKPGANPVTLPSQSKPPPPPPAKMLRKPEARTPTFSAPPPSSDGKAKGAGGFEWIPWSELSSSQRAGRSVAVVVAVLVILFMLRGMLHNVGGGGGNGEIAPAAPGAGALSDADRKDGIASLCKVFQIYGLPKNDHDATEAAGNAAELYKLSNQSPERSAFILNEVVGEFRAGKLGQPDCAEAGFPLPTTPAPAPDDSAPETNPGNSQQQ